MCSEAAVKYRSLWEAIEGPQQLTRPRSEPNRTSPPRTTHSECTCWTHHCTVDDWVKSLIYVSQSTPPRGGGYEHECPWAGRGLVDEAGIFRGDDLTIASIDNYVHKDLPFRIDLNLARFELNTTLLEVLSRADDSSLAFLRQGDLGSHVLQHATHLLSSHIYLVRFAS